MNFSKVTSAGRAVLSRTPLGRKLEGYTRGMFQADLQAGVTVAVFAIPQAMAYAIVAGVAPVYGLYSAIVISMMAALFGDSDWVNAGPTNSAALLAAGALAPLMLAPEFYLEALFVLTLLVGLIRYAMGRFRLGFLVDFVPESAFLGFTVGAGFLIAMSSFHFLLGVERSEALWFPERFFVVLSRAHALNPVALGIGLAVLGFMLVADRVAKKLPSALIALAGATAVAAALNGWRPVDRVADIYGQIPFGLPAPHLPRAWPDLVVHLIPGALAIALLGLIEAVSIGQTLALRKHRRLDVDREFKGQGISHIVGAFFQCIPGSGSFSRSVLILESGGVTALANVLFGLTTAVALLLFPRILDWIPMSALSGLLIYIGIRLVDMSRIRRVLRTSRNDTVIMLATLGTTVLLKIEWGIFVGLAIALALFVQRSRQLQLAEMIPDGEGGFSEIPLEDETPEGYRSQAVVVSVAGDLFFGLANPLRERLGRLIDARQPRVLVLRMRRAYAIDFSCWSVLVGLARTLKESGGRLVLCGVRPDVNRLIRREAGQGVLEAEDVFPQQGAIFEALRRAIRAIASGLDSEDDLVRLGAPPALFDDAPAPAP